MAAAWACTYVTLQPSDIADAMQMKSDGITHIELSTILIIDF